MNTDKIKEKLSNELGDKLRSLEMDVTNSFLSGKICSPLVAASNNAALQAQTLASGVANSMAAAGLYITKDGLQFDPTVMTDAATAIINSSIQLTTSEIVRLKDNAMRELTYIPDPTIIMNKALSYFAYNIQNEININELLDNVSIKVEDKVEEHKQNLIDKTKKTVENFISDKIPKVTDKLTTISNNISDVTDKITSYIAFGPDYVLDKVAYYIGEGSYIAETFLNKEVKIVNDWKMAQYDKVAYTISETMTKQYENLIQQNLKELNDEVKIQEKKLSTKATALIQKANLAIMAKTGIKIPIEKLTPENYNKVKRNAELSKLLGLAAQATPSNGPENSNDNTITNKAENPETHQQQSTETSGNTNSRDTEELELMITKLNKIHDKMLTVEYKLNLLLDKSEYEDQWDDIYEEMYRVRDVGNDANMYAFYVKKYIDAGDSWFDESIEVNKKNAGKWYVYTRPESYEQLINEANDIIQSKSSYFYKGILYVFDEEDLKFKKTNMLGTVDVIGTKKNNDNTDDYMDDVEYTEDEINSAMYNQTFMNNSSEINVT